MEINKSIVDLHRQLDENSCIPSAVEMVLKLLGKADPDYHELQKEWDNKSDGSFADFDERTIRGVTFKLINRVSFDELFEIIDRELKELRYVIISLRTSPKTYHMYVIYRKDDGNFKAFTKKHCVQDIEYVNDVKEKVRSMGITDILTYSEVENQISGFYAHISRMYNSAINTLTAIIFGWIALIGVTFSISKNSGLIGSNANYFFAYKIISSIVISLLAFYFLYFRILRHGKFIAKIENDLRLRKYIRKDLLPLDETLPLLGKLIGRWNIGKRPNDDPKEMSLEEKIACFTLLAFFVITIALLFLI